MSLLRLRSAASAVPQYDGGLPTTYSTLRYLLGSDADPKECLEEVVTKVRSSGKRQSRGYETTPMDTAIAHVDKRFRRVLAGWGRDFIPGATSRNCYAMKEQLQSQVVETFILHDRHGPGRQTISLLWLGGSRP